VDEPGAIFARQASRHRNSSSTKGIALMGNRLLDDVPTTDRGGSGPELGARGEATAVIRPRDKLSPDAFAPKPRSEDARAAAAPSRVRRPTTLPPPRSAGNRLPGVALTRRVLPVATILGESQQTIAAQSILGARSSVVPPAAAPAGSASPAGLLPVVASPLLSARRVVVVPPIAIAVARPAIVQPRPPLEVGEATQVASPPPPPSIANDGARTVIGDRTEIVTPLPFPSLVVEGASRRAAEPTLLVIPLPPPRAASTPSVVVEPGLAEPQGTSATGRRRWFAAAAMGATAIVAGIVIAFSSAGVESNFRPANRVGLAPPPAPSMMEGPAPRPSPEAPPPPANAPPAAMPATVTETAPERPRTRRLAPPARAPGATHRSGQIAKHAARSPSKPTGKPRPLTYDPDSLFLNKP
jgi:hypothetical protein